MTYTIEDLKTSPLFKLSSCSLEDFHTNFLAWLAETYPKQFLLILKDDFLNVKNYKNLEMKETKTQNSFSISKEKTKNLKAQCKIETDTDKLNIKTDLFIEIFDKEIAKTINIYIENKLKSFPNDRQLKNYISVINENSENSENIFILLSMAEKIKLFENINTSDNWKYFSYSKLAEKIENIFNNEIKYKDNYHKYLINDYKNVITFLSNQFSELIKEQTGNKLYNFYNSNCEKLKELKKIKLHSIYIKYRTDELFQYIENRIPKLNIFKNHKFGSSFNHGKGTIDLAIKLKEKFFIGIQIEEKQYRYFFIGFKKEDIEKRKNIFKQLSDNELWFKIDKKQSSMCGEYCHFNPDFIYNYENLNLQNISYEEISNKINEDFKFLEKNIIEIEKLLNEKGV
ncbi:MAG: hypothetical protein WCK67_11980 [bacterium]